MKAAAVLLVVTTCLGLSVAKLPQYNGTAVFGKAFAVCGTSEVDQQLMKAFELPVTDEAQAGCVTHFFWEYFDLVNAADRTTDVAKVKQQFVDYDRAVPGDTDILLSDINVDTEREKLGGNTFQWLKNNRDDVRYVYFGNALESFER